MYQAPEEKRKKYYRVAEQREVVGIYKKNTIYLYVDGIWDQLYFIEGIVN